MNAFSFGTVASQQARLFTSVLDTGSGNINLFIREPERLKTRSSLPVILFYMGDGADVTTTTVTGAVLSSGDTFTWTATLANSGNSRILSTSVIIKDDGVEIARGLVGGKIRGQNITTGSVGITTASSSLTITSSVALSGSITVDYVYSTMFLEGPPMVLNMGDTMDERGIFVGVQNATNDTDYTIAKYFDPVVKYLYNTYDINPNQIHVSGISRGGRFCMRPQGGTLGLIDYRCTFWINPSTGAVATSDGGGYTASGIASITCATTDIGGTYTVANYDGIGIGLVQGTADTTLTNNLINLCTTWGNDTSLKEYPYTLSLWNINHTSTVWHTNYSYRLWRTDTAGTATWDWVDFQFKYSKNLDECATLFVQQAEKRRYKTEKDIIDYREAVRKVSQLGSGSLKTALEARLSALKTTLDSLYVWRVIVAHSNSTISPTGNYNVITNHADNQRIDNLIDDNGNTITSLDWFVGDNPLTSNYQTEIASNRGRCTVGGFPVEVNRVGQRISTTVCPVGFDGLPTGTYTLRIYHNEGSGSYTDKELTATINGSSQSQFSQINRMNGYIEWTGLDQTDIANYSIGSITADIYVTATELIRLT